MTQTGYVNLEGGKVYYETAGEGETLVLSHAGFVDSRMWNSQWDDLSKHYRVIRFDMRGFGKSDRLTAPVSRRQDLYQLLKHLEIKRTHLLGCSMSGTTVIDFALEYPDMVASLIPVSADPSGFEMEGPPPPNLMEMFEAVQHGDLARASELQLRLWIDGGFRQPNQVDPKVRQLAADMNKIFVENGTFAMDQQPVDPLDPPAIERLGDLKMPALIIVGALDHPELLRAADIMAARIKGAKKVTIPDAGHMPNMDKPAEFNQAVLSFLKGI